MQQFFHSFKAAKYIFGAISGAQGSLCADRPTGCSGLIRVLATMNRVLLFVPLFAEYKINQPLAGGGEGVVCPLENFINNFKTSADIDAKLTIAYTASI